MAYWHNKLHNHDPLWFVVDLQVEDKPDTDIAVSDTGYSEDLVPAVADIIVYMRTFYKQLSVSRAPTQVDWEQKHLVLY